MMKNIGTVVSQNLKTQKAANGAERFHLGKIYILKRICEAYNIKTIDEYNIEKYLNFGLFRS